MVSRLYVIRDAVADESGDIFEAKNDGVAFRKWTDFLAKNPSINTEEFKLVCVGEIDHETDHVQPYLFDVQAKVSLVDDATEDEEVGF